jgi:hypothetical protein
MLIGYSNRNFRTASGDSSQSSGRAGMGCSGMANAAIDMISAPPSAISHTREMSRVIECEGSAVCRRKTQPLHPSIGTRIDQFEPRRNQINNLTYARLSYSHATGGLGPTLNSSNFTERPLWQVPDLVAQHRVEGVRINFVDPLRVDRASGAAGPIHDGFTQRPFTCRFDNDVDCTACK